MTQIEFIPEIHDGPEQTILEDDGKRPSASAHRYGPTRFTERQENFYRKVFIVVFEEHRPLRMATKRLRRLFTGKQLVTDKERLMY